MEFRFGVRGPEGLEEWVVLSVSIPDTSKGRHAGVNMPVDAKLAKSAFTRPRIKDTGMGSKKTDGMVALRGMGEG